MQAKEDEAQAIQLAQSSMVTVDNTLIDNTLTLKLVFLSTHL